MCSWSVRKVRGWSLLSAAVLIPTLWLASAQATVVERVVAVVGEQAILLSELRQRARPMLMRIYTSVPAAQRPVAEAEMQRELLARLVDERVVALAADKLSIQVTTREVDEAVRLKASAAQLSVAELVAEAARQGLSEADFREELRRELLIGKMLETRVRGRVRPTEDDARDYYKRLQVQERRGQPFRASIIAIDLGAKTNAVGRRSLADAIVKKARAGVDFDALARAYSTDPSRERGGDVGQRSPGQFGGPLDEAVLRLDPGQVAEPYTVGNKLVIVKVTERPASQLPPYNEVRDQVVARVRDEQVQKQVKVWLDELKSGVFIDVRL